MHTTTVTNQSSLRSTSSTFVSDKRTKRGRVQERKRLANVTRAIASQESSDNEDDWYDANRKSILRERFSSTSPLILLRVASKLATLKQSRQSHYADFAGFPSRKSFQVGRKYHDALAYAMHFFFTQKRSQWVRVH